MTLPSSNLIKIIKKTNVEILNSEFGKIQKINGLDFGRKKNTWVLFFIQTITEYFITWRGRVGFVHTGMGSIRISGGENLFFYVAVDVWRFWSLQLCSLIGIYLSTLLLPIDFVRIFGYFIFRSDWVDFGERSWSIHRLIGLSGMLCMCSVFNPSVFVFYSIWKVFYLFNPLCSVDQVDVDWVLGIY